MDRRIITWTISGLTCLAIVLCGVLSCNDIGSPLLDAIEDAVYSQNKITADFSASKTMGPVSLTVMFSDESKGDVSSWEWDFGDGGSATIRNPSHVYDEAGVYTVRLTVTGPIGTNTVTKEGFIVAQSDKPVISFDNPKDGGFVKGTTVDVTVTAGSAFTNVPLKAITFEVNGGDTQIVPASSTKFTHTFDWVTAADTLYLLEAVAIDDDNEESDPLSIWVTVDNTPPTTGSLSISPSIPYKDNTVFANGTVTVSGSASDINLNFVRLYIEKTYRTVSETSGAFSYAWDTKGKEFGDGDYVVYARVYDKAGNAVNSTKYTVYVDNTPPGGTFTINNDAKSTTTTGVTLTMNITDRGSGMIEMRFRNEGEEWSDWEEYDNEKRWTLDSTPGLKKVYAEFKDRLENTKAFNDTIEYRRSTTTTVPIKTTSTTSLPIKTTTTTSTPSISTTTTIGIRTTTTSTPSISTTTIASKTTTTSTPSISTTTIIPIKTTTTTIPVMTTTTTIPIKTTTTTIPVMTTTTTIPIKTTTTTSTPSISTTTTIGIRTTTTSTPSISTTTIIPIKTTTTSIIVLPLTTSILKP
ncbi:MAG: PKD domain-containing protein [Spirochaetales bacterium]|nr:PKD domain-containing protein [Spirochaetales bacterium]